MRAARRFATLAIALTLLGGSAMTRAGTVVLNNFDQPPQPTGSSPFVGQSFIAGSAQELFGAQMQLDAGVPPSSNIKLEVEARNADGTVGHTLFSDFTSSYNPRSGLITFLIQQQSGAVKTLGNFPLLLRIENALASYAVYLGQTFCPARLAVFYPFPANIPIWKPFLGAALLIAVSAIGWKLRKPAPYLIVCWAWFVITLVPVIGIVQVGAQSHADRYMYLPMTGLLIMLAWGVRDLVGRWRRWKPAALAVAAAACASCAVATTIQLQAWQNSGTLFEHALAVTKDNYIAEHNLGSYLLDKPDQLQPAISHLKRALEINPNSAQAHSDLGIALAKAGRPTQAAAEFRTALRIDPTAEQPRQNLATAAEAAYDRGVELMKEKNTTDAIQQFQAAIAINPDYAEAHNDLGVALSSDAGKLPEAISEFEAAARIKPDYIDAQYNLGAALAQAGKEQEALAHFQVVQRLRPDPQVEGIIRQLGGKNAAQ